jgi:uncharacterized protein (DUF58 family)
LQRWWLERLPLTDNLRLAQNNVYILPTRAGWMLAVTLLTLLIGSINYQLSLGYLLTFLLAGCGAASMAAGHGILCGLELHMQTPQPVFAGRSAVLQIKLTNNRRAPRHAISMALKGTRQWSWTDVPGQSAATVKIGFRPLRRGLHCAPTLTAETRYPLGAFRVWTIWRPAAQILVYPAPETPAAPLPPSEPRANAGLASGEFDGVRAWQRGDPLKLIVWKKFAKSSEPIARATEHMQRQTLWLDYSHTGHADAEARLSRLTAWVLAADDRGLDYGLRLPGVEIAPASGAAQRLRCLEALALA